MKNDQCQPKKVGSYQNDPYPVCSTGNTLNLLSVNNGVYNQVGFSVTSADGTEGAAYFLTQEQRFQLVLSLTAPHFTLPLTGQKES